MSAALNVLHLATFDTHGGAAVAALRLVEGLRRRGHTARLLVRDKATQHPAVEAFEGDAQTDRTVVQTAWLFSQHGRSANSSAFSTDLPTHDLAGHPLVRRADVLHLHWVTGFVSAYEVRRLQNLGKPVIWTLHDQFPLTGGCHYAQSCRGFTKACTRCPQLVREARPLASLTLADRRHFIDPARLVIAAPSEWLAAGARASTLFRRARIDVVPYGIDVATRRTVTRDEARRRLEIPADATVLFTASADQREPRKGHKDLVEALKALSRRLSPELRGQLLVLTAGEGGETGVENGLRWRALGPLAADDERLTMAYRAADVFALPSLDDNLPNTLLEAMAAGIPVVAYRTGGIPDLLQDGVNGRVVPRGDIRALSSALLEVLSDRARRERFGSAAGVTALARLDWRVQAEAYERIYERERSRRRKVVRRDRKIRTFDDDPHADARRVSALASDRRSLPLLTDLLRQEVDSLQDVIAARGGEIRDLHALLARSGKDRTRQAEQHARELEASGDTAREHERHVAKLQDVISARGGEIRDLRRTLGEAQQAAARRKEVLSHLMRGHARGRAAVPRLALGVFGVGESGRRVLEAAVLLDCEVVWLADNNADLQGITDLGCAVLRPEAINGVTYDAIVIASAHRDAIRQQLMQLGVRQERIVAPDVTRTDAELLDELRHLLMPHQHATVHSARSNIRRT